MVREQQCEIVFVITSSAWETKLPIKLQKSNKFYVKYTFLSFLNTLVHSLWLIYLCNKMCWNITFPLAYLPFLHAFHTYLYFLHAKEILFLLLCLKYITIISLLSNDKFSRLKKYFIIVSCLYNLFATWLVSICGSDITKLMVILKWYRFISAFYS